VSPRRKVFVTVLAVAAVLSLAVLALWLNAGKAARTAGTGHAGISHTKVTFAEGARTGNVELDTFIRDFVELCLKGDYDRFRLCWTAYSPQIGSSRFRAMWDAADRIVITEIVSVPGKAKGKAYVVKASVSLSPKAKIQHKDVEHKDVEVLVLWEDGKWVIAPAPHGEPDNKDLHSLPVTESAPASQPDGPSAKHG
jgi:hypothetical protein